MTKQLLALQWKSFWRSASLTKDLGIKIFLGFLALYLAASFAVFGFALHSILKNGFPEMSPLQKITEYTTYWLVAEFFMRAILQSLPEINIKSFLLHHIAKQKLVHFVLLQSVFSFFNVLIFFFIIPFGLSALFNNTVTISQFLSLLVLMVSLVLILNYLNFYLQKTIASKLKNWLPFIALAGVLVLLKQLQIFDISFYIGQAMYFIINHSYLLIIPLLLVLFLYQLNYAYLKSHFYLDDFESKSKQQASIQNFEFTSKLGAVSPYMQLDLKLIWRNKRPRMTLVVSSIFLLYGLIFFGNESYQNLPIMPLFASIFITGMFMINFGQFIPAWDSHYFPLIHSQHIVFKDYLLSKWYLMVFATILLALLSTPYAYFGLDILWLLMVSAIYNIGVNSYILLMGGSFNKKRIDLDKSPFMNYQGTGAAQWIIGFPLLLIPIGLWALMYFITNFLGANLLLLGLGLLGIVLKDVILKKIAQLYYNNKYKMIEGYKQQEN